MQDTSNSIAGIQGLGKQDVFKQDKRAPGLFEQKQHRTYLTIADIPESRSKRLRTGGDHKHVRTDTNIGISSLEAFFGNPHRPFGHLSKAEGNDKNEHVEADAVKNPLLGHNTNAVYDTMHKTCVSELTSVQELWAAIDRGTHNELSMILQRFALVGTPGVGHDRLWLLQHKTALYTVHVSRLWQELMYQQVIRCFGTHNHFLLAEPLPVIDLVLLALDAKRCPWSTDLKQNTNSKVHAARAIANLLVDKGPVGLQSKC